MLFRKDMSGYPLGTFFIAVFFPSNLFSSPMAVHGPHFLGVPVCCPQYWPGLGDEGDTEN